MSDKMKKEIMARFEKEIMVDLISGMPISEIMAKYKTLVNKELFPRDFIVVLRIAAPDFATEADTARMVVNKLHTAKVVAIAEIDNQIAIEVILHNLATNDVVPLTDKVQ